MVPSILEKSCQKIGGRGIYSTHMYPLSQQCSAVVSAVFRWQHVASGSATVALAFENNGGNRGFGWPIWFVKTQGCEICEIFHDRCIYLYYMHYIYRYTHYTYKHITSYYTIARAYNLHTSHRGCRSIAVPLTCSICVKQLLTKTQRTNESRNPTLMQKSFD